MKRLLFTIVIATCLLSACATPLIKESTVQNDDLKNVIITIEQTEKPSVTPPAKLEKIQVTQTPKPTAIPSITPASGPKKQVAEESTLIQTVKPTAEPTEAPTQQPTAKPTVEPTLSPTLQPTAKPTSEPTPTPTPEPKVVITPVSSSYINGAMAEINRLRAASGIASASYSESISSRCQNHAVKMAESGLPFHASGVYMFEAVGRASRHMPGGAMGGSAANHVVQLQSEDVTKIGIGAVYYSDYVFYVVRGD